MTRERVLPIVLPSIYTSGEISTLKPQDIYHYYVTQWTQDDVEKRGFGQVGIVAVAVGRDSLILEVRKLSDTCDLDDRMRETASIDARAYFRLPE